MSIRTNFYPDGTTINTAADFIAPWAATLSDGVFGATDFAASADSPADLAVSVAIGRAIKDGHFIRSDAAEKVPISANTSGYNRIDTIVLQVDDTGNLTTLAVVQGTPSSSPTAPILQANQLPLAQVMVGNNVSVIDSSAITDIRPAASLASGLAIGSQVYSHKDDNFTSYAVNANIISFTLADAGTYILSAAFQADSTPNARTDIYAYCLEGSTQHSISKVSFPFGQDYPCVNLCGAFTANAGDIVKMDYWGASSQSFSHSCNIIRIR